MLWGSRAAYAATMAFASTLVVVSASGQQAFAQEGTVALDTITVTGEKIERDIMETASSVSVISAEDLAKKQSATSVADAIADTPNVVYTGTVGVPVIRGLNAEGPNSATSAFFAGTIPRATVNLDGHYQNYWEFALGSTSIWDVQGIEVFRGPQTTSQGANAIAGAIIVNTKDPTFTPEGAYQVEAGSYGKLRTSIAASRPIIDNELAARISIDYWGRDTFIDYINQNFNKGDTDDRFRTFNARGKLLWTPTDIPGLTAKLTYAHTYNNRPTTESASPPYDKLESNGTTMASWNQVTDSGVLDLSYDLGTGIKLFNQTQYSETNVDRVLAVPTTGAAIIGEKNATNETRATWGDNTTKLSGVTGVFVSHTTSDVWLNTRGISTYDDEKLSLGVYTESTYKLTDRWSLTGGLRYQRDNVQREGVSSAGFGSKALDYDETFEAWLPKVSLAYEIVPDVIVGALFNKGYNPGGINFDFYSSKYTTFDPEMLNNYELFTRARLLDHKLTLTGNLFYTDYKNAQRVQLAEGAKDISDLYYVVVNADSAEAYGLEVSATYQLRDDLRIKGGAGLLHTRINKYTDANGNPVNEGNEFANAPGYTLSAGVEWDIIDNVKWSFDVRHIDGAYSTDNNSPLYEVNDYTVANSRLSYQWKPEFEVYAYANNIFDEREATWRYRGRSGETYNGTAAVVGTMLEPRMIGVGIKGTF